MSETLVHAYIPLILWMSLGLLIFKFLPQRLPKLLGRGLYWVGVPLELLALARKTNQTGFGGMKSLPILPSVVTVGALLLGLLVALLLLWGWKKILSHQLKLDSWLNPATQGSLVLAAVLGNTGFVGLAIAPSIIPTDALNWVVLYSITHSITGPYWLGVLVASYFSHKSSSNRWWMQLRDIATVPALWGFVVGILTAQIQLPQVMESGLQESIHLVIPCAFLLTGIRLGQLQGWQKFKLALIPAVLKVVVMPLMVALVTTYLLGLSGDRRLAMILMSGMPSGFAGLILAEEYNLDRDLVASSILLSTLLLLLLLPLWIKVFS
ncbi:MAG: AEC family transporter [Nodularia sp. (in: Bacteria)]|nr:MAG: AEC family transporter [Nodularia sp. (in: cyanobacteria)]